MEVEAEKKRSAPTGALEVLLPFYFMKVHREVTLPRDAPVLRRETTSTDYFVRLFAGNNTLVQ